MTVQELIKILSLVPESQRNMQVRVWMPGSQIDIDCYAAFPYSKTPDGSDMKDEIMMLEGNVVEGSLLRI